MNEADLIERIRADIDSDVARLEFAQWLDERQDPRGEFIRVQCALGQMSEFAPEYWDLKDHEVRLLAENGQKWRQLW